MAPVVSKYVLTISTSNHIKRLIVVRGLTQAFRWLVSCWVGEASGACVALRILSLVFYFGDDAVLRLMNQLPNRNNYGNWLRNDSTPLPYVARAWGTA